MVSDVAAHILTEVPARNMKTLSCAQLLRVLSRTAIAALVVFTTIACAQTPPVSSAPPKVRQIKPVPPPKDAQGVIMLFGGKQADLANWVRGDGTTPADWPVEKGAMTSKGGDIQSRERFTDFRLHVEVMVPYMPDKRGQGRGNSGVFMQGRYEIQVLDSYGIADPGTGDCGAVYSKSAPLVNACKPPLAWQTFDYIFRAPRFDENGNRTEAARITVIQNDTVVHNNTEIDGPTWGNTFGKLSEPGPIVLQFHGNTVQYRNVWIIPLPLKGASHY
jgi:hypothetical protein